MPPSPDPFARIRTLYHFTDITNLESIRRLGGLFSTARLRGMNGAFCAGGDEDSLSLDTRCGMDRFVHLCWAHGHPMAGRIAERNPAARLTYLPIDRTVVYLPGVMFSTGIAYANSAETMSLNEACERNLIDFHALYTWTDWRDPEAQSKRRAAELCEILIPDHIPLSYLKLPNG
jgi:hypothetical protein